MKKYIFIAFFMLFFITQGVIAEKTCRVVLTFYKNNSASLDSLEVLSGDSEEEHVFNKFRYSLQLISKNKIIYNLDLNVNFIILTDPPREVEEKTEIHKIPCINADKIVVYDKQTDKIILEADLKNYMCNKNNICELELGETIYNCPQDCLYEKPKYIYLFFGGIFVAIIILLIYKIKVARI